MKRSLRPALTAGIIAAALALTGCGAAADSDTGQSAESQVLRFGISGEAPVLKAGQEQGNLGFTMDAMLHRGLVSYDASGEVVPALASEYEQVTPSEYRFTLREGLTFHDGTELTLDSVKDSFEYFANPENGSQRAVDFARIATVEPGEGNDFTITLTENDAAFLQVLANPATPILPAAALSPDAVANIGAGPFEFVSEEPGVGLTLKKFDGYYNADGVEVDGVDVSYYADGAARVNALMGGDVDLIDYVPWESYDQLESAGYTVDAPLGPGLDVQFNHEKTPFDNAKVREAVAYAIDREKIVNNVFSGRAEPIYGQIVQPGGAFDTPLATEGYAYNPEKAKALLAEAGFPDGFDTTLTSTSQYAFMQDMAISMKEDLDAVGIRTELVLPDWPTMMEALLTGNYDLTIGTVSSSISDPSYLLSFVRPPAITYPWGYDNPEVTSALESGRAASDDAEQKKNYDRAFELIREETPYAVLVQRSQGFAFAEDVDGFKTLPGLFVFFSALGVENVSKG